MARELQSVVKMSRREGYALHPKAHKALVKRSTPPGQQNRMGRGSKPSQYSIQLREKQKVKRLYGLLERQFRNLMKEASVAAVNPERSCLAYLNSGPTTLSTGLVSHRLGLAHDNLLRTAIFY